MKLAGRIAKTRENRKAHRIFVKKSEEERRV